MNDEKEQVSAETAEQLPVAADKTPQPKKKKRKSTMRRVRSISPMSILIPFFMPNRVGSQNLITDRVPVEKLEQYLKEKQNDGLENISMMHLIIAAYVRTACDRPAINRFIRGQRVWTRDEMEISLVIKREMSLDSPDTSVKIVVDRDATIYEIYEALNKVITEYRAAPGGGFDKTASVLSLIPAVLLRGTIYLFRFLDYFSLLPKFLRDVSPFHCSFFITSMGSLGIPPIYHHIYDFGSCPVFCSFGAKKRSYELNANGEVQKQQYMDLTFVTDERICDGYYFASGLKHFKSILKNPWQLDTKPTEVQYDVP